MDSTEPIDYAKHIEDYIVINWWVSRAFIREVVYELLCIYGIPIDLTAAIYVYSAAISSINDLAEIRTYVQSQN